MAEFACFAVKDFQLHMTLLSEWSPIISITMWTWFGINAPGQKVVPLAIEVEQRILDQRGDFRSS